jgi:hypothetical protein
VQVPSHSRLTVEKQTVMALPDEKMATLNESSSPVRDVGIARITPLVENADVAFQLLKNDEAAPVTLDKAAFARVLRKIDFLLMPVMASVSPWHLSMEWTDADWGFISVSRKCYSFWIRRH